MANDVPHDAAEKPRRRSFWKFAFGRGSLSILLCLGILFIGAVAFQVLASLKKEPEARPQVVKTYNVSVYKIVRRDLEHRIEGHGTAVADRSTLISAKVAGQLYRPFRPNLTRIDLGPASIIIGPQWGTKPPLLKESDRVKAGQPLFLIDPRTYRRKYELARLKLGAADREIELLRRQQANSVRLVAEAQKDVKTYQKEYDSYVTAKNQGAAVESQLTQAKLELQRYKTQLVREKNQQSLYPAQLKQVQNRREQHLEEMRLAALDLRHARVVAEYSGTISELPVQPGEFVKLDDPIMRLTSDDIVEVPIPLSPDDHDAIAPMLRNAKSQDDLPSVQLAPNQEAPYAWNGKVVRLAPMADELTRTVKAYIRIDNKRGSHPSSERVKPGQHCHAVIFGRPLRNTISIPREAILWRDSVDDKSHREARVFVATQLKQVTEENDKVKKKVWVGIAKPRTIVVSRMLKSNAVITSGLKPGDQLILTNLDVLHDGARVRMPAMK